MSSVISSTGRRPALLIAGILLIATTLRVVFTLSLIHISEPTRH